MKLSFVQLKVGCEGWRVKYKNIHNNVFITEYNKNYIISLKKAIYIYRVYHIVQLSTAQNGQTTLDLTLQTAFLVTIGFS